MTYFVTIEFCLISAVCYKQPGYLQKHFQVNFSNPWWILEFLLL